MTADNARGLESVDDAEFGSSFRWTAAELFLVYELAPGIETTVTFNWYQDGEFLFSDTFDWRPNHTWGWAGLGPPTGGFEGGSYEVEITLDTGESRTVPFTIERP
jgi:hypothetical protein